MLGEEALLDRVRGWERLGVAESDRELEVLADIARVEHDIDAAACLVDALRVEPVAGLRLQFLDARRHVRHPRIVQRGDRRAHEGLAQIRHDQALRAQDAGRERHERAADAEALRDIGRVQRPGAAERQQREGARIVAALDRHRADRTHHVGDHDAEHAVRGALDREAESLGERRDRLAREVFIERHVAAEQAARREPPEHEVRVGDSGLLATTAVAGRARLRARALRADLHQPVAVEPGDRAAACADRVDVERGEARRIALDPFVEGRAGRVVADQRDVRAGAAHVERDDVRDAGEPRHVDRADRAGGGAGQRGADRHVPRARNRHQPAGRLVDAECRLRRGLGEAIGEFAEIAVHHRLQIGIEHRGREPLVLAEFRLHLGRDREVHVRKCGGERVADHCLVRGIEEREQQAHRAGVRLRVADLLHQRAQRRRLERAHRAPIRGDALGRLEAQLARHQRRRIVGLQVEHLAGGSAARSRSGRESLR